MMNAERSSEIMKLLKEKKIVSVDFLCKKLFASGATIRRDLDYLEKQGFIKRTFGGAVLLEGFDREIPLTYRESENIELKRGIAHTAASLIKDASSMILDSSSTALQMIPYLADKRELVVITNGLKSTQELGESGHNRIYCTGGRLRENSMSFVGSKAERFVSEFFVDIVFFSCRGISMAQGITDSSEAEAELRKVMLKCSKVSVLLCDSTKIDQVSLSRIGDFTAIDYIITDKRLNDEWKVFLAEKGVRVLYGE